MPARAVLARSWTPEEFYAERDAAPPGVRMELVDGELLVTPAPGRVHQRVVLRLSILLDAYVRAHKLGEILCAPFDVRLDRSVIFQPDLLLIPADEPDVDREARYVSLAVEVLSKGSGRHDRVKKRPVYQRYRVSEHWIVDSESETIERWTPDDERPDVITERLVWHPAGASAPFVLEVPGFFREIAEPL
jgi:Uma2 family endonuclease